MPPPGEAWTSKHREGGDEGHKIPVSFFCFWVEAKSTRLAVSPLLELVPWEVVASSDEWCDNNAFDGTGILAYLSTLCLHREFMDTRKLTFHAMF
jgi:hypothetical protein